MLLGVLFMSKCMFLGIVMSKVSFVDCNLKTITKIITITRNLLAFPHNLSQEKQFGFRDKFIRTLYMLPSEILII